MTATFEAHSLISQILLQIKKQEMHSNMSTWERRKKAPFKNEVFSMLKFLFHRPHWTSDDWITLKNSRANHSKTFGIWKIVLVQVWYLNEMDAIHDIQVAWQYSAANFEPRRLIFLLFQYIRGQQLLPSPSISDHTDVAWSSLLPSTQSEAQSWPSFRLSFRSPLPP